MAFLMKNRSVDGTDITNIYSGDGAEKQIIVYGTSLGGGSISLQVSQNNGINWIDLTLNGVVLAITSFQSLYLRKIAQGIQIRAVLSGSSGASNVNVSIEN